MSSASFNEKTTAGFEGGGCNGGLDFEVYLFILDSCQLEAAVGSNELFLSCHVLGSVDAMLRFIHAIGLFLSCHVLGSVDAMLRFIHAIGSLKLAVLVPVHACIQQIILVFVCGMYPL